MRWRFLILVSLGLNLAFASTWLISHNRHAARQLRSHAAENISTNQVKMLPVYRKQFFSWREVESEDYPTYIANLRDIGCPESTIRDIIIADVNELYARKKATEVITTNQQWWRTEPDTKVTLAASEKNRALDEERRALLARLLGPNWESPVNVSVTAKPRVGIVLDGPVLGLLPDNVKESVEQISARATQRTQAYIDAQRAEGKAPDPAELARLRQQTRTELASVLNPQQLEEYLLRYSENANNLRAQLAQLKYFNATPEEFRYIFRATDQIDQQIQALAGKDDPNSIAQRKALEQQRQLAIKNTLGSARYAEFRSLQDPTYRDAYALGKKFDSPQSVQALYEINQATAEEKSRINADTNLTAEQKAIALKHVELEQLKAQSEAAGQELPASVKPAPTPEPPKRIHTISAGESVATVSLLYRVAISAIRDANPNVDFTKLKPGDSIFIPPSLLTR